MANFGHFWPNFMHVVHKVKFVIFCTKPKKIAIIIYCIRLIFCGSAQEFWKKHNILYMFYDEPVSSRRGRHSGWRNHSTGQNRAMGRHCMGLSINYKRSNHRE